VSVCTTTKKLLTVKQVADRLSISVHTVYKWAEVGKLPKVKLGYVLRFDPERIEQLISEGRHEA